MVFERPMRSGRDTVVVESFASVAEAERAVRELRDAGFSPDAISVVARDQERAQAVSDDTGADTAKGAGIGALTGAGLGALGGLLLGATALAIPGIGIVVAGPLAALLGGAGIGGVTGGLAGALAGLGVSDDEAEHYQKRLEAGDIVVAVAAGEREWDARQILKGDGYREEVGYRRAEVTEVRDVTDPTEVVDRSDVIDRPGTRQVYYPRE